MKLETRKWLAVAGIAVLVLASMGACGAATPEVEPADGNGMVEPEEVSLDGGEKLRVVATTNIVGDVVGAVGGDVIDLSVLMSLGVDPHTYVPTPSDTAAIHDAHVVFASGAGLEADLEDMLKNAGGEAVHVQVSEGLEFRSRAGGEEDEQSDGDHEGKSPNGHDDGEVDPHVWFSVPNVIHWVASIEHTLSALDPANAEAYEENAREYIHELEMLDAWVLEQVAQIPESNREFVTNHPAFGYLAERYGLEQVGAVYPVSPSSEPSARDIAALEDSIREFSVPAVFTESTVNPKLAEQVAQDTGVKLVALYSGSLSEPGGGAETYILLMRYDVSAIVEALKVKE